MSKYVCTKYCQARVNGQIKNFKPGDMCEFAAKDIFPENCFRLIAGTKTTASEKAGTKTTASKKDE